MKNKFKNLIKHINIGSLIGTIIFGIATFFFKNIPLLGLICGFISLVLMAKTFDNRIFDDKN